MDPKKRAQIESESRFTRANRQPKELITLGGTAITKDGKITKSNYFRFLNIDLDKYDDIKMTLTQARKLHAHLHKLSTGATAMTPMYCAGALCPVATRCPLVQMRDAEDPKERGHPQHGKAPVGKQCHAPGTQIFTTRGYKNIEDLDPEIDKLVSYANSCGLFRKHGRSFKIGTREYSGVMIYILA